MVRQWNSTVRSMLMQRLPSISLRTKRVSIASGTQVPTCLLRLSRSFILASSSVSVLLSRQASSMTCSFLTESRSRKATSQTSRRRCLSLPRRMSHSFVRKFQRLTLWLLSVPTVRPTSASTSSRISRTAVSQHTRRVTSPICAVVRT